MSRAACCFTLFGWLGLAQLSDAQAETPERATVAPITQAGAAPRLDSPPAPKRAAGERVSPRAVAGIERRGREPSDAAREVLDSILWHPRQAVEVMFFAAAHTAGLIDDEQVIPRMSDTLNPPHGEVRVFPTFLVETAGDFSVGMRLLARDKGFGSTVRIGAGGPRDLVAESRLNASLAGPRPLSIGLEVLHDVRSSRVFLGVGQAPADDPRNHFRPDTAERSGSYQEVRERVIVNLGSRPFQDVEVFISSSLTRRRQEDTVGAGANALSRVFEVSALPGGLSGRTMVYQEAAARVDTRESRSGASPGLQFEAYAGQSLSLPPEDISFIRTGGRIASYIEIYKPTNILSPRVVLDTLHPLRGIVPWNELTRQPDFRGSDNRRDTTSLVASLDYRWTLMRYLAARLFVDAAQVSMDLPGLRGGAPRFAGGLGVDAFTRTGNLGSLTTVISPEGYNITLKFGVGGGFGDRQHRD